jgi:hypothetical protein
MPTDLNHLHFNGDDFVIFLVALVLAVSPAVAGPPGLPPATPVSNSHCHNKSPSSPAF